MRVNYRRMSRSRPHIVVIGAGIGGLAAAARLAHAGLRVTVLERQDAPGGKMRTLPTAAGAADAGPTVLTLRGVFDGLFRDLGLRLDDHVTLRPEPVLARHWWPDGTTLDLFADAEASAAAIRAFAGERAEAQFRRFTTETRRLFEAFERPMMHNAAPKQSALALRVMRAPSLMAAMAPHRSLASHLARRFDDPRLRQLFARYATYVGGSPYEAPALLSLIGHAEAAGVWRVGGGMHALAQAVAHAAQTLGADVRYGAPVRRIEVQDGNVAAVHTGDERLPCTHLVFNGDPRALVEGMLGEAVRPAVPRQQVEPRSLSAHVWTFAARPHGRELSHHNVLFGADPRSEFDPIARGRMPEDPAIYVCAQDRGAGLTPPAPERFEIIVNAPPLPHATQEEFPTCLIRTFRALAARGLTFTPEPGRAALTRPEDFDALFPASHGSLYGRSPHGLTAGLNRPTARTRVPGLYLAGGGAHPGAGVPMAALSGRHAAEAILTDHASTSTFRRGATPGGTATGSATTAAEA